ncbi:peroxisomal membrane protein 11C [Latimeria chalumnae]|uniref:peroxisomal membrane protein 11C n=1 Tax=Latimeria chalumnae TaxID=7897 RepID=UPI00313C7372
MRFKKKKKKKKNPEKSFSPPQTVFFKTIFSLSIFFFFAFRQEFKKKKKKKKVEFFLSKKKKKRKHFLSFGPFSPPSTDCPGYSVLLVINKEPGMGEAEGRVGWLVNVMESHRGRDRVVRMLCYGSQLVGGVLARCQDRQSEYGKSLLVLSAQLSHCRTVLRLFDDLSMLAYTRQYGWGTREQDPVIRWISLINNLADQIYYPCEHLAWAADAKIVHTKSEPWWTLSAALWGLSLLLGVLRSLRVLLLLRRKLKASEINRHHGESSQLSQGDLRRQVKSEFLNIISSLADLGNAVHWMPPGFLWAGKSPEWLVGLLGLVSSLIGLYHLSKGENAGSV